MKIINSNGFAEISNFVFSEIVSTKKFNSFDNYEDYIVLQKIKNSEVDSVWYINPKIDIKENDLVFCHTEVVEIFFDFVANIKNLKNIKLITISLIEPLIKAYGNLSLIVYRSGTQQI